MAVRAARLAGLGLLFGLVGCGQSGSMGSMPSSQIPAADLSSAKIQHVVIIFQENRSTDDLFNGFPGADTVRSGLNSRGRRVPLKPVSLTAPYDLNHNHSGYVVEYAGGKMNGFNQEASVCISATICPSRAIRAYGYVPHNEIKPYFAMARQYAFGDRMFQTNQGPSFPAHQYIVSGTSTVTNGSLLRAAENPFRGGSAAGGCDSASGSLVALINQAGKENQNVYPCFNRISLMELLDRKALTWRYYQATEGAGIWNAPDAVLHIRLSPEFSTDVVAPPSQVLTDIAAGNLADVVWVTPTGLASDHAMATNGSGPSWVASIVNAIGESQYWNHTAIFVTWDDWGGWYDHVKPPVYNSYELGFRVPLIVISPYAKNGYVSHVQHEFGSILKFTEKIFGLPSLHTTDVRADDLFDCFDFAQPPSKFKHIPAKYPPSYFLRQPSTEPDN
jgi:phospholipase C